MSSVEQYATNIVSNKYVQSVLMVLVLMYASQFAPKLNDNVTVWFNNTWVKVSFIFAVLLCSSGDIVSSLLFSLIIVGVINYFTRGNWMESFDSTFSNFPFPGTPQSVKILTPELNVIPGCTDITLQNLLDSFTGDFVKRQTSVNHDFSQMIVTETETDASKRLEKYARLSGVPFNVEINDENAPLIATYLLMYGFQVPAVMACSPPGGF
jgi:hypothetical protein